MAALFYVDDGMVVSPRPERLQRAFIILANLFERVGLRKYVRKTVSMDVGIYLTGAAVTGR